MTAEMTAEGLPLAPRSRRWRADHRGHPRGGEEPTAQEGPAPAPARPPGDADHDRRLVPALPPADHARSRRSPRPRSRHYTTPSTAPTGRSGVAVSPSGDRIYVTQSEGDRTASVFDAAGTKLGDDGAARVDRHRPRAGLRRGRPAHRARSTSATARRARSTSTTARQLPAEVQLAEARPGWQPLGLAFDAAGQPLRHGPVGPLPAGPGVRPHRRRSSGRSVRTRSLNFPNGVGVDTAGNVYVTDSNNGRLLVYDRTGSVAAQVGRGAGEGNLGPAARRRPSTRQGRVFVVDTSGQAVFVYKAAQRRQPPPRLRRLRSAARGRRRPVHVSQRRRDRRARPRVRGGHVQRPRADLELLRLLDEREGGEPGRRSPPTVAAH